MTVSVLKVTAASLAEGKQVRIVVVTSPTAKNEEFVIPDTTTEATVVASAGRRILVIEENAPASTAAPAMKEVGDASTGATS
jgi:hydroxymethylglutaryl-CoA reductase